MIAALIWLLVQAASAGLVPVEHCVRWDLSYNDAATGDFLVPDTNGDTDKPARGVLLRFVRPNGTYFGYFMDWEGTDRGCRSFAIDDSLTYTVKVISWAKVNGNDLEVVTSTGARYSVTVDASYSPSALDSETHVVGPTATWNILGAAAKAMQRHNLGISGETFRFEKAACPGAATSCDRHVQLDRIYIDTTNNHDKSKFTVLHELGHAMGDVVDEHSDTQNTTDAPMTPCGSSLYAVGAHFINSKEYQANAAVEGFAYFFAAASLNKYATETDCQMDVGGPIDWNHNNLFSNGEPQIFACDSSGVTAIYFPAPSLSINGEDYMGDRCSGSGVVNNRGVEYDWIRHFWSLMVDDGFTLQEVVDIWDEADPNDWNGDDNGNGNDDPADRMDDAAFTVGGASMQADYQASAILHGTDQ